MDNPLTAHIRGEITESVAVKQRLLADPEIVGQINQMVQLAEKTLRGGGKIMFAGNGGSAADSQHLAAEFVGQFNLKRKAIPAFALSTDTSILTSVANDVAFEQVFARQIEALGNQGDIFVAISTSGNSKNLLAAIKVAREKGLCIFGLTGAGGGEMARQCDHCIRVPSNQTPRIQEAHILIGHIICGAVEELIYGKGFQT